MLLLCLRSVYCSWTLYFSLFARIHISVLKVLLLQEASKKWQCRAVYLIDFTTEMTAFTGLNLNFLLLVSASCIPFYRTCTFIVSAKSCATVYGESHRDPLINQPKH